MTKALLECIDCKGHGVRIARKDCCSGRPHAHVCDRCGGQGRRAATVLGEPQSGPVNWTAWKVMYFGP